MVGDLVFVIVILMQQQLHIFRQNSFSRKRFRHNYYFFIKKIPQCASCILSHPKCLNFGTESEIRFHTHTHNTQMFSLL